MPKAKPVINLITGELYVSASDAGRKLNIDNSDIGKACKSWFGVIVGGRLRCSVGRYKWMYYEDYVKIKDKTELDLTLKNQWRSVQELNSGLIYKSITEASRELKLNRNIVSNILQTDGAYIKNDIKLIYVD